LHTKESLGQRSLSHFACAAFMEWPEFVNLSGRVYDGTGHDLRGPFSVEVVDQNHPVTRGLGAEFQTVDELYTCLTGDREINLLCRGMSKKKKTYPPLVMVCEPGKGRTFHSALGHDVEAHASDAVKQLFRQGTAWAAGLEP
jgi:type 1 glutamine amidotransferase